MFCHMCGQPASETCAECGQPVCDAHQCGTDMGMYWGVCEACFQRLEERRWQNYMRHQQDQSGSKSSSFPQSSVPAPSRPQPVDPPSVNQPDINRGYILTWLGALLFTGVMAGLMVISAQSGQLIGVLLFGGLGLKMLHAMLVSDTFRWLRQRLLVRSAAEKPPVSTAPTDTRLHHLLGHPQADVIARLGEPENRQDLSLRDGVLSDIEMGNLEYFAKGLRFFIRRSSPENPPCVESIHYISQRHPPYQTYPAEIIPGLRVGLTQTEIEAVLGQPDAADMLTTPAERQWRRYTNPGFPAPIQAVEVWYPDNATAVIVAIAGQRNFD